jgi:putative ABC transport system permease protein
MITTKLIQLLFGSYLKQEKLRILFTLASITLGISIFVSTRIITENILQSFDAVTTFVSQKDSIQITSDIASVPENIIPKLLTNPVIDKILPISTQYTQVFSGGENLGFVRVMGVDMLSLNQLIPVNKQDYTLENLWTMTDYFLNEPVQVLVSDSLGKKAKNLTLSLLINGTYKPLQIKSIFNATHKISAYSEDLIVIDIKNFQNLFDSYQKLDQINLTFNTTNIKDAMRMVAPMLPKQLKIHQGNLHANHAEDITKTFRFNLNLITSIALLVTSIIIYNAVSYFMLDRRRDFGIMLMLGAHPKSLFLSSLLSSLLFAIVCAVIGIIFGYLITFFSMQYIVETFSTIYLPIAVTTIHLPIRVIIEVFLLTTLVTLIVSLLPCFEVYFIPLRQATYYQTYEEHFQINRRKMTLIGCGILCVSCIFLLPNILNINVIFVYTALLGVLLSSAFFLPFVLAQLLKGSRKLVRHIWVEATIAVEHIYTTMRKHTVAICTMSISISLYITVMIVMDSTHFTATNWINQVISADIYISEKNSSFNFLNNYIPDEFVQFIKNDPDIKASNFLTHKDVNYQGTFLRIIGMDFSTLEHYFKLQFTQSLTHTDMHKITSDMDNVFISDHLANAFHLKIGDPIFIPVNHGYFKAKVANIAYNYASYQDLVWMSDALFTKLYGENRKQNAMLYLYQPQNYQKIIDEMHEQFPNVNLDIQYQLNLKTSIDEMLLQTFKISRVIVSIILILTALTLFNTLEQLILSRRHEFAIFWSIGANDFTLLKMCLWEAFIIYGIAVLNAIIPTILILGLIFNYLDKYLFGTDIFLHVSYFSIIFFIALLFIIVLLDGLIPALRVRKLINAEGLRCE